MWPSSLVHLGDIKPGRAPCTEDRYRRVADLLRASAKPVFIVPGDNEWNGCADPGAAWTLWKKYFLRMDSLWGNPYRVSRQPGRRENFTFVRGGVLFAGVNLVGPLVIRRAEWKRRLARNASWIRRHFRLRAGGVRSAVVFAHYGKRRSHGLYSDFFAALAGVARAFKEPVLFLQGQFHAWEVQRGFLAKNITRVMAAGGSAPPQRVIVTLDANTPFRFPGRDAPGDSALAGEG